MAAGAIDQYGRTSELGKWLTAHARRQSVKGPTPWDRLLAHKDNRGRLLLRRLPYVDGSCVTPTEWKSFNPSHKGAK